jgi:hypothetical protein
MRGMFFGEWLCQHLLVMIEMFWGMSPTSRAWKGDGTSSTNDAELDGEPVN